MTQFFASAGSATNDFIGAGYSSKASRRTAKLVLSPWSLSGPLAAHPGVSGACTRVPLQMMPPRSPIVTPP